MRQVEGGFLQGSHDCGDGPRNDALDHKVSEHVRPNAFGSVYPGLLKFFCPQAKVIEMMLDLARSFDQGSLRRTALA